MRWRTCPITPGLKALLSRPAFWLIPAIGTVLLLCACSRDTDYTPVDFSKRVSEAVPRRAPGHPGKLRVAVSAMISPKETFHYYNELLRFIGENVGRDIEMIQRKTYGEVNELFARGEIDMAFVCSGPYAVDRDVYRFEAVVTPVVRGEPYYRSYLIVHRDSTFHRFSDLRGRTFAFTDPASNTGSLVPKFWLNELGETPEAFFERTVYTYSHDNSIMAVAKRLVDGAAVDGHKWEYFQARDARYTSGTRIIRKSEPFGSPPLVVAADMDEDLKRRIQGLMLELHNTEPGKALLGELMIDRFIVTEKDWYRPVRAMAAAVGPATE